MSSLRMVRGRLRAVAWVLSLAVFGAGLGAGLLPGPARAAAAQPATSATVSAAPAAEPSAGLEVIDLDWQDAERQRAVPARLYWPAQARQAAVPLVVFSHGLGGSRMGYRYLGQYWAEQGFASLHLQHLGSDREVWRGSIFSLVSNLQAAASDMNAANRAIDVRFAISQILSDARFGSRIRSDAIAVAGHSYGANTALLVSGARVLREGVPNDLRDARVKAAVLLSAPPFYGEPDMRPILAGVEVPTLHVTGTEDVIRVPGYRSDPADRVAVFDATGSSRKLLAVFRGGTHSIFTDRTDQAGPELNRVVKRATREVSALFLDAMLRGGDAQVLDRWLSENRGLFARVSGTLTPSGAAPVQASLPATRLVASLPQP